MILAFLRHTIPLYGICEHILSQHDHSNSYVFHVVHCRPKNFEFPNHCDMKLVTLNYGISTTQTETRPIPNPQGNADAISELFFSKYQDCFQGIGCSRGQFQITLAPCAIKVNLLNSIPLILLRTGDLCLSFCGKQGKSKVYSLPKIKSGTNQTSSIVPSAHVGKPAFLLFSLFRRGVF